MSDFSLLAQKAIKLALAGQWQKAVELNSQILEKEPENINAMLRLAKAYTYVNKVNLAKRYYRRVLSLDRYNPIAKRNLLRLQNFRNGSLNKDYWLPTTIFLEEPGKTKSVYLVRVTDEKKLVCLEVGEPVEMLINPNSITITKKGKYLGRLPDDLAFRLIRLCRTGNQYEAFIRLVEKDKIQIFIRELKRSKRNQAVPSFPSKSEDNGTYQSFLPTEALADLAESRLLLTAENEERLIPEESDKN